MTPVYILSGIGLLSILSFLGIRRQRNKRLRFEWKVAARRPDVPAAMFGDLDPRAGSELTPASSGPNLPGVYPQKIGLALSGGGFRASIFHLGVIRRLEELGIMPYVSVISAVSGGSIIAAYYVVEMEKRLRSRYKEIWIPEQHGGCKIPDQEWKTLTDVRLELFEKIAADFLRVVDLDLRSRAFFFGPFYHPLRFLRMLKPGYTRSTLMQAQYDRKLYKQCLLDQLPSARVDKIEILDDALRGPKVILNTTSLMDGERVPFSRVPLSGVSELSRVDSNSLKLSQVVAASAAVPGVLPPITVRGRRLVDGGVSDNQGLEALLPLAAHRLESTQPDNPSACKVSETDCDVLIVSDASGQLEAADEIGLDALTVISRTLSIFQHQVRNKLLDRLVEWKYPYRDVSQAKDNYDTVNQFAFVHLWSNLKDRPEIADTDCVPTEFIGGIARIRTDLDQFSPIEREALMYHGYTLIDAQIKKFCPRLERFIISMHESGRPALEQATLFREQVEKKLPTAEIEKRRQKIVKSLSSGSSSSYFVRSWRKHPVSTSVILILLFVIPWFGMMKIAYPVIRPFVEEFVLQQLIPYLPGVVESVLRYLGLIIQFVVRLVLPGDVADSFRLFPSATDLVAPLSAVLIMALMAYLLIFTSYEALRFLMLRIERRDYRQLSGGVDWTIHWRVYPPVTRSKQINRKSFRLSRPTGSDPSL